MESAELSEVASIPPSALPGISPTRGEIGKVQTLSTLLRQHWPHYRRFSPQWDKVAQDGASPISPLVGEMPGRAEGGAPHPRQLRFGWSGQ
ncbi:hypothetical protein J2Z31_000666 [Sinorhizobium kostiense]|uniref:Lytic murein transglycosylase n=1 Tax=Sinorhizobium kostiense TaxID=76747 RepID=A0ABS4QVI7_9HYPH|nr:hypothetical protein [Sinorhizobium kostiense]